MNVEFKTKQMNNDYGNQYGVEYIITGPEGFDFLDLQQELIVEEIGENYYYGNRDVWDQILIVDGRNA